MAPDIINGCIRSRGSSHIGSYIQTPSLWIVHMDSFILTAYPYWRLSIWTIHKCINFIAYLDKSIWTHQYLPFFKDHYEFSSLLMLVILLHSECHPYGQHNLVLMDTVHMDYTEVSIWTHLLPIHMDHYMVYIWTYQYLPLFKYHYEFCHYWCLI